MSKIKAGQYEPVTPVVIEEVDEIRYKTNTDLKSGKETDFTTITPPSIVKKVNINVAHTSISNPDKPLSSLRLKNSNSFLQEEKPKVNRAPEFPMSCKEAIKHFKNLNDFEVQESANYDN